MGDDNTAADRLLESLLGECVRQDASDLHLVPDLPPYLRVEGLLQPQADRPVLSAADTEGIAMQLSAGLSRKPLEASGSLDGAMTGPDGTRYRFNVFRRQGRLSIARSGGWKTAFAPWPSWASRKPSTGCAICPTA